MFRLQTLKYHPKLEEFSTSGSDTQHDLYNIVQAEVWKYYNRLVRPGPNLFRTSSKFQLTCPGTRLKIVNNSVFHILIYYYNLTCCMENIGDSDQLASLEAS